MVDGIIKQNMTHKDTQLPGENIWDDLLLPEGVGVDEA